MTAVLARSVRKAERGGHMVQVGAVDLHFETLLDGYGDEALAVLIWTHDLPDAEAWWRARAYLEGPGSEPRDLPGEWGFAEWVSAWPVADADLTAGVRRVWARWVETGEDEADDVFEIGLLQYVESATPADGFEPVTVVELVR